MVADTGIRQQVARGIPYSVAKEGAATPIAALVHTALTGALNDTLVDVAALADAEVAIKNLAAKINEIIVILEKHGLAV